MPALAQKLASSLGRIGPARAAPNPYTAFVLSGGGSLGALQAGMVQALYERGIRPDVLVGTSAGAINAAFLASRPQTVQTAQQLEAVWCSLHREDVFPVSMRVVLEGLRRKRNHVVPDRGLRELVRRHVELETLQDATPPLHVVCSDLMNGNEVVLSTGPARDAVIASASIPGILPPVKIADRWLIDGSLVNSTPISHALDLGAERIYVLPTQDPSRLPGRGVRDALDAALHGLRLLAHSRMKADLERLSGQADLIVLPAENRLGIQPSDFGHARALIADALGASRRMLDLRDPQLEALTA